MNKRIEEIRKDAGLTQEEFARRLGMSRSFINQVAVGKREVSDRTIADICREFHVREAWLRTGKGPMREDLSRDEELAAKLGEILTAGTDSFRKRSISVLVDLPPEKWIVLEDIANRMQKAGTGDVDSASPALEAGPKPWNEMTKEEKLAELSRQLDEEEATEGKKPQSGGSATA